MEGWIAAGLGLEKGTVRLDRTTDGWLRVGAQARDEVAGVLDRLAIDVEHVGSSSVEGLLAKPIIDLAVGVGPAPDLAEITGRLTAHGWLARGDARENGGHLFVLETRPLFRVAHVHVVQHEGSQWRNYLRFRDLLRADPLARSRYEAVKQGLAASFPDDRGSYTSGKADVVRSMLQLNG